ncbi:MAG: hypothetical protein WCR53_01715 [Bacteroidaceae bacterium]|nr:hypothetical protein [Bacteroidaceae bacterium]
MSTWRGILRAAEYSPNSNDLTIMQEVASRLQTQGNEVSLFPEQVLIENVIESDAYFSMARSQCVLSILEKEERRGAIVFNSPRGVRNCSRPVITRLMMQEQISMPESIILDLDCCDFISPQLKYPCWLKRGDSCAQQKADVCFVKNENEYRQAVEDFRNRSIYSAVFCEHIKGDVVKFYGVADSPFFYWYYPTLSNRHGKFGLEEINGPVRQYSFNVQALKKTVDKVAEISDTPIYGGDCIVDASGDFKVIDFNDWPSFSSCVDEAADAISNFLLKHYSNNGDNKK